MRNQIIASVALAIAVLPLTTLLDFSPAQAKGKYGTCCPEMDGSGRSAYCDAQCPHGMR